MRAAIPVLIYAAAVAMQAFAQAPAQSPPTAARPAKPVHHAAPTPAKPTGVPGVLGPMPAVPLAPPPVPVIPPPDAAPPHPNTPPPPPPVHDDAPGAATKIDGGLRLTFGEGRSDFNPASEAALLALAQGGLSNAEIVYNLYAHAPGAPEDTSTPRRLSLERALMVRSALINAGIPSIRIYVHAMGANGLTDAAPADRVDITLATLDTTRPVAAPTSPAGTTPPP